MLLKNIAALKCTFLMFLVVFPTQVHNTEFVPFESEQIIKFSPDESYILETLGALIGLSMGEVSTILSLTKLGLGMVPILETIFTKIFNGSSIDLDILPKPGMDRKLLAMFEVIAFRLDQIEVGVKGTESGLRHLVRGLPHMVRWEIALDTMESYTNTINNLYHRFTYYQKHSEVIENATLIDFAKNVVSHEMDSIQSIMANIHSLISPSSELPSSNDIFQKTAEYARNEYEIHNRVSTKMSADLRKKLLTEQVGMSQRLLRAKMEEISLRPSIFNMLEEAIENYETCSQRQSPQQLIFGLYTLLAVTQARAYSMVAFSYNFLRYHNEGAEYVYERKLSEILYEHYSQELFKIGLHILKRADTSYKNCDPANGHKEGETYVMLTELLQGYIENEVDMNIKGSCGSKCSTYQHTKAEGCYLPDTQYCGKHRRCKGTIHDCQFFDSDADVCLGSQPYRRYDWIRYENTKLLGVETSVCKNKMKIDSWWRFLYHCSYCMCFCDDQKSPTSDRFISLRASVSDIVQNKVITGLRFMKKNRVLHIQVEEGAAIAQGQVDIPSTKWREIETIDVANTDKFKDGVDFFTLKYEARNFDLDHLTAPKGYIVTGVRFRMLGQHVNLEAFVTPINFTTGELNANLSFWISNDNTPIMVTNPRRELKLLNPDDSTKSVHEMKVDSVSNMFVTLQPTSLHKDVGQLTVPFFDAQPVAPSPVTWLNGVQVYHRGREGYGGFIALQVFNYDLSRHLQEEKDEQKEFRKGI